MCLPPPPPSQIGTAMCLSAVIEAVAEPDSAMLKKLMASGSGNAVKTFATCLMEFLSIEDWLARKAAAEGLMKLALVENEPLREIKSARLKTFEAKRFDNV